MPGITLVTYHADCLPLYLYDPAHQAVALLHAGWRGTVDRIALCGLEKMQEAYGTRPSDVIAGIGPGISAACYETSEAVRIQFAATFPERDIEKIFTAPHTGEDGARHWQLDLALANFSSSTQAYRKFLTAASAPTGMQSACFRTAPKGRSAA